VIPASYQWMKPDGQVQQGAKVVGVAGDVAWTGGDVVVGAAVGQALHTGQVVLTFLAGDALLSPDRLTSDPHGHGGHVVVGATVVGLGVN